MKFFVCARAAWSCSCTLISDKQKALMLMVLDYYVVHNFSGKHLFLI